MALPSSHLSSSRLLDLLAQAESPAHVSDLLHRTPARAFVASEWSVAGLVEALHRTQGPFQTSVLHAFLSRGPAVFGALDVSRHLVIAQQVGQRGDSQGVAALERAWGVAGLPSAVQESLQSWVGRHALLRRHAPTWDAVQRWPSEQNRPDKLRLSFQDACAAEDFHWGWQFLEQTKWEGRVETAWAVLDRGCDWHPRPSAVESPSVTLKVAHTLLADLPWDNEDTIRCLSALFSLPGSPLIRVVEQSHFFHPHARLEALEGCLYLAEHLESHRVRLVCGSLSLRNALSAHQARFQRAG